MKYIEPEMSILYFDNDVQTVGMDIHTSGDGESGTLEDLLSF